MDFFVLGAMVSCAGMYENGTDITTQTTAAQGSGLFGRHGRRARHATVLWTE